MEGLISAMLVGRISSWALLSGAGLLAGCVSVPPELLLADTLQLLATEAGGHALVGGCSGVDTFSLGAETAENESALRAECCAGGAGDGRNAVDACPLFGGAEEEEGRVLQVLVTVEMAVAAALVLGTQAKSCFLTEEGVRLLVTHRGWVEAAADEAVTGQLDVGNPGDSVCRTFPFWLPTRVELLCFGELFVLPGLTGLTGNGPQVFGEGEKVPPNWAIGKRGCRICCIV